MKTKMKFYTIAVMVLALSLASCSKEGDMGPIGPEGPQGEQGPVGPQGPAGQDGEDGQDGTDGQHGADGQDGEDGKDGKDGNAEIYYSDWIRANFTGTSTSVKFMSIDFPSGMESASRIKNTHAILVYFTGFGDGNVYQLPVLNFRGAQFTFGYGSGSSAASDINIRAQALSGDLTEFQIDPDRGARFRYVIIPPNIRVSGKSKSFDPLKEMKVLGIELNDYHAVMDYFGLDY